MGGAVIPNNTPIVYPIALGTTPDPLPLPPHPFRRRITGGLWVSLRIWTGPWRFYNVFPPPSCPAKKWHISLMGSQIRTNRGFFVTSGRVTESSHSALICPVISASVSHGHCGRNEIDPASSAKEGCISAL